MKKYSRNDPAYLTIGPLISTKLSLNGIELQSLKCTVLVTVYSPEIFRIEAVKKGNLFQASSYAVIANAAENLFSFEEDEQVIRLLTAACTLEIVKSPIRFVLKKNTGEIINEDDFSFGMGWLGSEPYCFKKLQHEEKFFGLGEKTGRLNRRGSSYTNWNTDYFGYPAHADPLYQSIPFYIGYHHRTSYGIFFDNTYRTNFDFAASNERFSFFSAADGPLNYYLIAGDSIPDVIRSYTYLTGRMPLPPKWSLGMQQCRYSYYPDKEVLSVARTFREKKIPCDVIYLDIHYMQDYKVFTWNRARFPEPEKMLESLRRQGFHVVPIFDPGIKKEEGYEPFESGMKNNSFVKYPNGEFYEGEVWPGVCYFPDFTNYDVRQWWGEQFESLVKDGIDGFWNDMNEPAAWGQHIPEIIEFDYEGEGATLRKARNIYGMQMVRSTYEGTKKLLKNSRPFCLTRAGFSGVQRYSAVWTGDNVSSDEHLLLGVRLVNSLGLSGVAFAGCDVGGFSGECSPDLFARWIAIGAFTPFFRCHSMINSRDAEPWAFGEEVEDISRNYITLRYRLMPYLYSAFYESSQSGMPVNRSLLLEYPDEPEIFYDSYQHQFLFGPSLMVAPVVSSVSILKIYLPSGKWFDFYRDAVVEGNQMIFWETPKDMLPLFVKANGILILQEPGEHTGDQRSDVLEIHCYPVAGFSDFHWTYYDDDGISYDYQEGNYAKRTVFLSGTDKRFSLGAKEGTFASSFMKLRVYFHGIDGDDFHPRMDDNALQVLQMDYRFIIPISNFDPVAKPMDESKLIRNLKYVELAFSDERIEINW